MSLDIRFSEVVSEVCPHCGEIIGRKTVDYECDNGACWYGLLRSIGYYVPVEQRTEGNDRYGKDMTLTLEQAKEAYAFAKPISALVASLIAVAIADGADVVATADW